MRVVISIISTKKYEKPDIGMRQILSRSTIVDLYCEQKAPIDEYSRSMVNVYVCRIYLHSWLFLTWQYTKNTSRRKCQVILKFWLSRNYFSKLIKNESNVWKIKGQSPTTKFKWCHHWGMFLKHLKVKDDSYYALAPGNRLKWAKQSYNDLDRIISITVRL